MLWTARSSVKDWTDIVMSADGVRQVAISDFVYVSTDSGSTWTAKGTSKFRTCIAMSDDGTRLITGVWGNKLELSTNSGNTWTQVGSIYNGQWKSIAMSSDGMKIVATLSSSNVVVLSDNGGTTWRTSQPTGSTSSFYGCAITPNGNKIIVSSRFQGIYSTINGGSSWNCITTTIPDSRSLFWYSVSLSSDGNTILAPVYDDVIYISTNNGVTWTTKTTYGSWESSAISSDGNTMLAVSSWNSIYISKDKGLTWTTEETGRNWKGIAVSSNATIFSAVAQSDYIYTASSPIYYTISIDSTSGGFVLPLNSSFEIVEPTVSPGDSLLLLFLPDDGYVINDVYIDGVPIGSVGQYSFNNIQTNHTVYSIFTLSGPVTHNVYSMAGANGSIDPEGSISVTDGDDITFTITPDPGFHVSMIIIDEEFAIDPLTSFTFYNVQTDRVIEAIFEEGDPPPVTYTINASSHYLGSISPSGILTFNAGTNQTYTFNPLAYAHLTDVMVDGVSLGVLPNYTFTNIQANHNIYTMYAANTYTITSSTGSNGSISPLGINTYYGGNSVEYFISPNSGYSIQDVLVDGVSVGTINRYIFSTIATNHTISATFGLPQHNITASSGSNGSISPSGVSSVTQGQNITYTISPNIGYVVDTVLVDGSNIGSVISYTFNNVTFAHTISVTFKLASYTINSSTTGHGLITPLGDSNVTHGSSKSYSISPDISYKILDVLVDGTSVGEISNYTFSNVISNHTIVASFQYVSTKYTISTSTTGDGSITPSISNNISYGASSTFTITPNNGNYISSFKIDGIETNKTNSYTFTNIQSNHTIDIIFESVNWPGFIETGPSGAGYWKDISISHDGSILLAVEQNGSNAYLSKDYGQTWEMLNTGLTGRAYVSAMSADGTIQLVSGWSNRIFISSNTGLTWNPVNVSDYWTSAAMSSDGTIQTVVSAGEYSGVVSISTNSGSTWTNHNPTYSDGSIRYADFRGIAMSDNGQYQTVVGKGYSGGIFTSYDYGITWTFRGPILSRYYFKCVAMSADGMFQVVGDEGAYVYVSRDRGVTWTPTSLVMCNWMGVTMSADGNIIIAVPSKTSGRTIAYSGDSGANWTDIETRQDWWGITMTPDRSRVAATVDSYTGKIYTFEFPITTWNIITFTGPNGYIDPGDTIVNNGSNQIFNIIPDTDYQILDVIIDGISIGPVESYEFINVTSDHTISATFELIYYNIQSSTNQYGQIIPLGDTSIESGESLQFNIIPNEHCFILDVLIDNISIGLVENYTFIDIQSNHTISAIFDIYKFNIISSINSGNGIISPLNTTSIIALENQSYTIVPDEGYYINDVIIDGISIGPVESYEFTSITDNHTISVTFEKIPNIVSKLSYIVVCKGKIVE